MEALEYQGTGASRLRWARACAAAALWSLPALVLTVPKGLLPFGLLLLGSSLLIPLRLAGAVRTIGWPWWLALLATAGPLLVVAASILWSGSGEGLDGPDRWLALPWVMAWAWTLQPPRDMLWRGALAGLVAGAALAVVQVLGGEARAGAWSNPIVFANGMLVLMVLAVFCRPSRSWHWTGLGLLLGSLAILLSGTRGTWPGLALLLLVSMLGSGWRSRRSRMLLLGAAVAAAAALLASVPGVTETARLTELRQDLRRIEHGDHNSSTGARLERLQVAAQAFSDAPWTGVGYRGFDQAMQRVPACRGEAARELERCHYGHAHNDLAEWAATMGVPGALALVLLYAIPLGLFLWLCRITPGQGPLRGSAAAGAMLVAVYLLGGLTQSMFAHQTSSALYAALCGLLLGLALRESGRHTSDDGTGVSTKV